MVADGNMKEHDSSPEQIAAPNDLESAVLDVQGFARLAHIPKATILTLRSRSPDKLPPPFRLRPLLWRAHTVVRWMEKSCAGWKSRSKWSSNGSRALAGVPDRSAQVVRYSCKDLINALLVNGPHAQRIHCDLQSICTGSADLGSYPQSAANSCKRNA